LNREVWKVRFILYILKLGRFPSFISLVSLEKGSDSYHSNKGCRRFNSRRKITKFKFDLGKCILWVLIGSFKRKLWTGSVSFVFVFLSFSKFVRQMSQCPVCLSVVCLLFSFTSRMSSLAIWHFLSISTRRSLPNTKLLLNLLPIN
jgi:hypothetical protein